MNTSSPLTAMYVIGNSTMRGITCPIPNNVVREMLPPGLELGPQCVTKDPGTHPVMLFFNDIFRVHPSIPALLPPVSYHEFQIGIPYTYLSPGPALPGVNGPYYFMPRLCLDHWLPILWGISCWGFAKEMASIRVAQSRYQVTSPAGEPVALLDWRSGEVGSYGSIGDYKFFEPIWQILNQTLISRAPTPAGPFFALSDFEKNWDTATLAPLQFAIQLDADRRTGLLERLSFSDWSPSIETSALGAYELRVPWQLSLPYPPLYADRRRW